MNPQEGNNPDYNVFELLNKVEELPPELKREVMATINFTHLATDIAMLFSIDMAQTAITMIDPGLTDPK